MYSVESTARTTGFSGSIVTPGSGSKGTWRCDIAGIFK
jgi:hypothetical protein